MLRRTIYGQWLSRTCTTDKKNTLYIGYHLGFLYFRARDALGKILNIIQRLKSEKNLLKTINGPL